MEVRVAKRLKVSKRARAWLKLAGPATMCAVDDGSVGFQRDLSCIRSRYLDLMMHFARAKSRQELVPARQWFACYDAGRRLEQLLTCQLTMDRTLYLQQFKQSLTYAYRSYCLRVQLLMFRYATTRGACAGLARYMVRVLADQQGVRRASVPCIIEHVCDRMFSPYAKEYPRTHW